MSENVLISKDISHLRKIAQTVRLTSVFYALSFLGSVYLVFHPEYTSQGSDEAGRGSMLWILLLMASMLTQGWLGLGLLFSSLRRYRLSAASQLPGLIFAVYFLARICLGTANDTGATDTDMIFAIAFLLWTATLPVWFNGIFFSLAKPLDSGFLSKRASLSVGLMLFSFGYLAVFRGVASAAPWNSLDLSEPTRSFLSPIFHTDLPGYLFSLILLVPCLTAILSFLGTATAAHRTLSLLGQQAHPGA